MNDQQTRELFETQWVKVLRLAGLLMCSDPEDVTAEAFARLYARRSHIRSPDAAPAHLRRTVVNLARDRIRRERVSSRVVHQSRGDEHEIEISLLAGPIESALARLPLRQREAVVLRFCSDLSERDIASAMKISPGSVKTHIHRGLAALKPVLSEVDSES